MHNYNGKYMNTTTFMIIRRLEVERWDIVIIDIVRSLKD